MKWLDRFSNWKVIGGHGKSCTHGWGWGYSCTALQVCREREVRKRKQKERVLAGGETLKKGKSSNMYYMLFVSTPLVNRGSPYKDSISSNFLNLCWRFSLFPLWVSTSLTLLYRKKKFNPDFYFWLLCSLLNYNFKYLKVSSIHSEVMQ